MQYGRAIRLPIRLPFHCTPIFHHSMLSIIQPDHPQLLLNLFTHLEHPHSHPKHTILLFPSLSAHLNPILQYPEWVPANDTKGHKSQLWLTIIFYYGKWCTMYKNNWTTWWQWWVQLQLPGANQPILNNQLQHPRTQYKETKVQGITDIWIGK